MVGIAYQVAVARRGLLVVVGLVGGKRLSGGVSLVMWCLPALFVGGKRLSGGGYPGDVALARAGR